MAVGGKLIALCFQQGQLELKIKAHKISGLVMSGKSGGPLKPAAGTSDPAETHLKLFKKKKS